MVVTEDDVPKGMQPPTVASPFVVVSVGSEERGAVDAQSTLCGRQGCLLPVAGCSLRRAVVGYENWPVCHDTCVGEEDTRAGVWEATPEGKESYR